MPENIQLSEKNSAFNTYKFTKKFASLLSEGEAKAPSTASRTLGLHAENVIVNALDRNSKGAGRTPPPNPSATAALKLAGKEGQRAMQVVDEAADQASKLIMQLIEQQLEGLPGKKEYRMDMEGVGGSSLVGDIGVTVNGKKIVFESKYQKSRSTMTRWAGLSSNTLFGDDSFKYHLALKNLYLHKLPETDWIKKVSESVGDFLNEQIGPSPKEQVLFFIKKGKGIPDNSFDAKYVIHMQGDPTNKNANISVTLTSMDELEERLSQVFGSHESMMYSLAAQGMVDSVAYDSNQGVLAQVGVTTKTSKDFTFEFYIAQKLLNVASMQAARR